MSTLAADHVSTREFTPLEGTQVVFAAIYLALIPVSRMTAIRSIAFGVAALLTVAVIVQSHRDRAGPIRPPGASLAVALAAFFGWSLLTLAWSVRPAYTLQEFRSELLWNSLTAAVFYVAAGVPRAWPVLTTSALASFAVSTAIALIVPLAGFAPNAEFWYGDSGYFSTQIVMLATIALTIPERSSHRSAVVATFVLLVLALATARATQNRIVFIALATSFATALSLVALRWRGALARAPKRWALALLALAVVLGALFVDVARERVDRDFPPHATVAQSFAEDPRLPLWEQTARYIRERPWAGYGYGRAILAAELRAAMGDDVFEHPHNLIASQWLQTGAVGVALLGLLLVAVVARYIAFYLSRDDRLAFVGLIGIALIGGFVVKNLTDDFLYRSGAREFFALNAMLIGWGMRRARLRKPI